MIYEYKTGLKQQYPCMNASLDCCRLWGFNTLQRSEWEMELENSKFIFICGGRKGLNPSEGPSEFVPIEVKVTHSTDLQLRMNT